MTFLAMIIAVLVDRLSHWGEHLRWDGWFGRWRGTARGLGLAGPAALAFAVVLPAVLAQLLLAALAPLFFGLFWIAAAAVLLLYSFGRANFSAQQERYRSLCRREDLEGAWLAACTDFGWLGEDEVVAADAAGVHARIQTAFLYEGYQRWFAVLFYFLLLGPAGALSYRLCQLAGDDASGRALLFVIDWLPTRALAATFSLVGDFVASVDELWVVISHAEMPAAQALYTVAMAATAEDRREPGDADSPGRRAAALNEAMSALLRRAAVCWVVAISLIVIVL